MVKCYRALESRLLGQIRKQEHTIESKRLYRPRVVKDLTIDITEDEVT